MPNWSNGLGGATVVVEWGAASTPSTPIGSTAWTAMTNDVREVSIDYGRGNERDDYQVGRMSAVIGNMDREFDPLHAGGAHFGQILPGKRIRVKVTVSAVTVALFTGYINGWPQVYDMGGDSVVALSATDGLSVLARTRLPSLYAAEVMADTPSLWWRLGEQAGTVAVDSSGNNHDGNYINGATFNSRAGLVVDPDTAILFTAGQAAVKSITWPAFPFSIELWFTNTLPADGGFLSYPFYADDGAGGTVGIGHDYGVLYAFAAGGSPVKSVTRTSSAPYTTYNDGVTHHVVATWTNGATAPSLYIDGVNDTTGATVVDATVPAFATVNATVPQPGYSGHYWVGTIDEAAVYPSALSAGRVSVHYNAGLAPLVGLDTGAAVSKVLDLVGWPSADRTIETGKSTVVSVDISGRTALDVIKDLEKTEQGRFFIAPDGKATFYNRHHVLTTAASTTSQATFGDGGGAERPYVELQPDYSDAFIRNSITTQRRNGSPFLVEDAASIAAYGRFEDSVTGLLNSSDAEVRDLGLWRLGHYKDPQFRFETLTVNPRRDPANLFPIIRDRKLCDRFTVKRRPGPRGAPVGSPISQDALIEGISHRISRSMTWTTTYRLSPADTQPYWVLGDATLSVLGGTTRLAF